MAKAQANAQTPATAPAPARAITTDGVRTSWREALPTLSCPILTLREPVSADAVSLLTALPEDALSQIVADPPPASVAGIELLIEQLQAGRRAGTTACWVIVPADAGVPVGVLGVRSMDHTCSLVEGFAVTAEEFRGTPIFQTAGRLVLGCLFGQMGVHRAEFRIDVRNGRANGALRKLGATQEGLLRRARAADGEFSDQVLWAIVATDWNETPTIGTASVH
jgi:RimJ/RimL family protein N-acetyltransferase